MNKLSNLFHSDPFKKKYSELKKGLEEFQFLLLIASSAVQSLLAGEYEKFDGLVGENACQIRAVKIILINKNGLSNLILLNKYIEKSIKKTNELLNPSCFDLLKNQGLSLGEIITLHDLEISLNDDEKFVILSFFLNEMKEVKTEGDHVSSIFRLERCSPSTLQKKYPHISYSFIEKVAKKSRTFLSILSVEFVRNVASQLQDPSLIRMVGNDFSVEHNNLICVPTFWSLRVLFYFTLKKSIPLVLHVKFLNQLESGFQVVDEEVLYFKPCTTTNSYLETLPNEEDLLEPACIIQGIICPSDGHLPSKEEWRKKISRYSVVDLILLGGAAHRQYPDPTLQIAVKSKEYLYYKNLAELGGFSSNNPTTFFAQHIYCSQVSNHLVRLQNCLLA